MEMVNRTQHNLGQDSWLANKGTTQIELSREIKDGGDDDDAEGSCSNKKSHSLAQFLYTEPIFKPITH